MVFYNKDILLLVLVVAVCYLLHDKNSKRENMTNCSQVDMTAISTLATVAEKLKTDGLTVPTGKLTLGDVPLTTDMIHYLDQQMHKKWRNVNGTYIGPSDVSMNPMMHQPHHYRATGSNSIKNSDDLLSVWFIGGNYELYNITGITTAEYRGTGTKSMVGQYVVHLYLSRDGMTVIAAMNYANNNPPAYQITGITSSNRTGTGKKALTTTEFQSIINSKPWYEWAA